MIKEFRPDLSTTLTIGSDSYGFLPHPVLAGEVQKMVREQTTIYQLIRQADSTLWALKVMNVGSHRDQQNTRLTAAALTPYKHLPGLFVANRLPLTKALYPELIAAYPALKDATLMPWITGKSWADFMSDPLASAYYTRPQAIDLAVSMARTLWNLENHQSAHTDIAGENVIVLATNKIELIDIEGIYIPGLPPPPQRSRGWQGYQHRFLDQRGNYRPDGDRFAGAILLSEMLTWWNPLVRALTPDEYDALFQFRQQEPPAQLERRIRAVRGVLWSISPDLCGLFDQAWSSSDLAQCPNFATWMVYLLEAKLAALGG
ncbi:MAG: hypothetical protein JO202_16255 [Ktedonobacteraceae bacterium]|nr:hypothetical protein [Ktedonobacteraceae bacterium]